MKTIEQKREPFAFSATSWVPVVLTLLLLTYWYKPHRELLKAIFRGDV